MNEHSFSGRGGLSAAGVALAAGIVLPLLFLGWIACGNGTTAPSGGSEIAGEAPTAPPDADYRVARDTSDAWLSFPWGTVRLVSLQRTREGEDVRAVALLDFVDEEDGRRELVVSGRASISQPSVELALARPGAEPEWEMGWSREGRWNAFFEQSGGERLEIRDRDEAPGRRRERYDHFVGGRHGRLELAYDPNSLQDVEEAERELFRFYPDDSALNQSVEGLRMAEILTDARFLDWVRRQAEVAGDLGVEQGRNELYELVCTLISECRARKCPGQDENPLCVVCTGGDIVCDVLRFLGYI